MIMLKYKYNNIKVVILSIHSVFHARHRRAPSLKRDTTGSPRAARTNYPPPSRGHLPPHTPHNRHPSPRTLHPSPVTRPLYLSLALSASRVLYRQLNARNANALAFCCTCDHDSCKLYRIDSEFSLLTHLKDLRTVLLYRVERRPASFFIRDFRDYYQFMARRF